jgi:hypothetical protein
LTTAPSPRSSGTCAETPLLPDFARQPNERGWLISIAKQRAAIRKLIDDSPGPRNCLTEEFLAACYADGAEQFTLSPILKCSQRHPAIAPSGGMKSSRVTDGCRLTLARGNWLRNIDKIMRLPHA